MEEIENPKQKLIENVNITNNVRNNSNVNDIVIPIILDGNELDRVVVSAEQRRFARNGGR